MQKDQQIIKDTSIDYFEFPNHSIKHTYELLIKKFTGLVRYSSGDTAWYLNGKIVNFAQFYFLQSNNNKSKIMANILGAKE